MALYERGADGTFTYSEEPLNAGVGSQEDNLAGQSVMDPLGFGNKARESNMNIAAQSRALNREAALWGEIKNIYPQLAEYGQAAYDATMNPVNDVYSGAQEQISNYTLAPEAQAAIDNILNTRLADVKQASDLAIGNNVADLARKGITSSSTMEGSMGEVGKAMQPAVNSALADYWQARLGEPSKNATAKYSLATDYGKYGGNALLTKLSTQLDPLMQLYANANANPFQSNVASQRTQNSASAAGGILKMLA